MDELSTLRTVHGARLAKHPCLVHCSVCDGEDHHWMEDFDEATGDPLMVCKHCDAWREYTDEDGC